MSEVIELKEYFYIIKKNIWKIILITIVFAIFSWGITNFLLKPVYEVSTTLIVSSTSSTDKNMNNESMDVSDRLILTYGEVIKSRAVLESVISRLNIPISYEELYKCIDVSIADGTHIINVKVESENPKEAAKIANEIPKILSTNFRTLIQDSRDVDVDVVDYAIVPEKPTNNNIIINTIIGGIFGFVLGIFIVIIKSYSDDKIKTPLDIDSGVGWRLLGVIPDQMLKK